MHTEKTDIITVIKRLVSNTSLLWLLPALVLLLVTSWQTSEVAVPVYPEYYLEAVEAQVDYVQGVLFQYPVMAQSFLITQNMAAGALHFPDWQSWAVFGIMILAFSFIIPAFIGSRTQWFYLQVSVLAVVLYLMGFNLLFQKFLFGPYAHILVPAVVVGIIYLGRQYASEWSFMRRWAIGGLPVVLVALVYLFVWDGSPLAPARFLAFGSGGLVIMALGFFAFTGADLLLAVYKLLTKSETRTPTRNVGINLLVFMVMLFLNMLLAYADSRSYGFTALYLPPYVVQVLTTVVGFWVMQDKEHGYESVLGSYATVGKWLYLGWAGASLSLMAWATASANDSLSNLLNDGIMLMQMSFTVMTGVYLFVNFGGLFSQLPNLYQVVFKPTRMPIWAIWFGMVLAGFTFVKSHNDVALEQYTASKFIGQAWVASAMGEDAMAAEFFGVAQREDITSTLATLGHAICTANTGKHADAIKTLEQSLNYQHSPQAYLMLAQEYKDAFRTSEYVAVLYLGKQDYPNDWRFSNNLALHFANNKNIDSLNKYITLASKQAGAHPVLTANETAYAARGLKAAQQNADLYSQDMACQNNLLAVSNVKSAPLAEHQMLDYGKDSSLNQLSFSYLYNYTINRALAFDTVGNTIIKFYSRTPNPRELMQGLRTARDLGFMKMGLRDAAVRNLHVVTEGGTQETYRGLYGLALLQAGAPSQSTLPMLETLGMENRHNEKVLLAELYALEGNFSAATSLIKFMPRNEPINAGHPIQVDHLLEAWTATPAQFSTLTQSGKVAFLAYRAKELPKEQLMALASSVPDYSLRYMAYACIAPLLTEQEQVQVINLAQTLASQEQLKKDWTAICHERWTSTLVSKPDLAQRFLKNSSAEHVKLFVNLQAQKADARVAGLLRLQPFQELVVAQAVSQYNQSKQPEAAYNAIQAYLEYVPEGTPLIDRLFVLQCFKNKTRVFAGKVMRRIEADQGAAALASIKQEILAIDPNYDGTIPDIFEE